MRLVRIKVWNEDGPRGVVLNVAQVSEIDHDRLTVTMSNGNQYNIMPRERRELLDALKKGWTDGDSR